ncbi:MAG: FtsW/RodA/SpoVE family cell cycle protein [Micropruina sp.]|nr:MAG: FtsW/RodA/SpoVE family cell cycle protein [Micropruina sp.]
MLVPMVLLLGLGVMMVLSASSVTAYVKWDDAYYFVKRQIFFLAVGGVGAYLLTKATPRQLKILGWALVVGALVLQLLTFTPLGWGTSSRATATGCSSGRPSSASSRRSSRSWPSWSGARTSSLASTTCWSDRSICWSRSSRSPCC